MILLLRMRRNTINSTSGIKMDLKSGFPVPKNIYMREIRHSNCILRTVYGSFSDFITAHAQKHRYFYFRYQNEPQIRLYRTEKNISTREIRPSNCILMTFFGVFHDFVTAHAQKHR